MELKHSSQIFEKYSKMKFLENPSSGAGGVLCRRTDTQKDKRTGGQTRQSQLSPSTVFRKSLKILHSAHTVFVSLVFISERRAIFAYITHIGLFIS